MPDLKRPLGLRAVGLIPLALWIFTSVGCISVPIADLNMVSTRPMNVPVTRGVKVRGEDCIRMIWVVPTKGRIFAQADRAIENALKQGQADMLLDAHIYARQTIFILYNKVCIVAEGIAATFESTPPRATGEPRVPALGAP